MRHSSMVAVAVFAACGMGCGSEQDSSGSGAASTSPSGGGGAGGDGGAGAGGEGAGAPIIPEMLFEERGLRPEHIAIVVNDQDPTSVALGAYYQQARGIPAEQVVTLSFATSAVLPPEDFAPLAAALEAALPASVQALALTWVTPYRVGCMSVTSAFSFGFDTSYCNTTGMACGPTAPVAYYDSDSDRPFDDLAIRPAMSIAATTVEEGEALIDRGIAADGTFPSGDGYLIRTTDVARSVRWPSFVATADVWSHPAGLDMTYVDNSDGSGSNVIANTNDVLFYFTGLTTVADIETNSYLPGAVADHLTSFGGQMPTAGGQMSILRWLEAGATGSFGTTVEPCNYTQKFPDPQVMLAHYFRGESLIEAYYKSVRWPGEGVFVGEPLARPWGSFYQLEGNSLVFSTTSMIPDTPYQVVAGPSEDGPWAVVIDDLSVPRYELVTRSIEAASEPFYRLQPKP
jgi:uncharacterized protein (TIGR03790 family)